MYSLSNIFSYHTYSYLDNTKDKKRIKHKILRRMKINKFIRMFKQQETTDMARMFTVEKTK